MVNTVLDWIKNGLRKAHESDAEIAPILNWKDKKQVDPEMKDVLMSGMATRTYVQKGDDLHLVEGALYRNWRSKDGLHHYEQ